MKKIALLCGALAIATSATAKLTIVTSTEDLAAIAREVAKDRADVSAIARGDQDPHTVEPKPSYLLKLRKADLLIAVGRELESAWLPSLVSGSRNPKLLDQAYLDASTTCRVLEVPTGAIDRSLGDVHPAGNPHYWLDPENGRQIARAIAAKLSALDAAGAAAYAANLADFEVRLEQALKRWRAELAPLAGREIVAAHNTWPNLLAFAGLRVVGYVEPKPGIPASPAHTLALIQLIKEKSIPVILVEPYFDRKTPNEVARQSGAKVLALYPSVGGRSDIRTYFDLFDANVKILTEALGR